MPCLSSSADQRLEGIDQGVERRIPVGGAFEDHDRLRLQRDLLAKGVGGLHRRARRRRRLARRAGLAGRLRPGMVRRRSGRCRRGRRRRRSGRRLRQRDASPADRGDRDQRDMAKRNGGSFRCLHSLIRQWRPPDVPVHAWQRHAMLTRKARRSSYDRCAHAPRCGRGLDTDLPHWPIRHRSPYKTSTNRELP